MLLSNESALSFIKLKPTFINITFWKYWDKNTGNQVLIYVAIFYRSLTLT